MLHTLKERRAAKVAEMVTLNNKVKTENRDFTNDEKKQWDTLDGERCALDEQIERESKLVEFEREMEQAEEKRSSTASADQRDFSVAKAIGEALNGGLTGREAEYAQERQRQAGGGARAGNGIVVPVPAVAILGKESRALTTATPNTGPGSNLVATDLAAMTDRRRPALKIEKMGAMVLRNLTGNFELPRLKESGSAGWVGEHEAAARSDAKFEKKTMGPKTVTAEYELSRRILLQSQQAIDTILRADLSYLLSQKLDAAAIKGGGSNEPTGILETAGIETVDGGAFDSNITADLIAALETDDVTGTTAFLTNPKVMKAARKKKDGQERVIPLSELFHRERVESSTQVPVNIGEDSDKNALIYGEWASLYLGYWSGIDLLVNPYHSDVASKGGILLHAFLDVDVLVRHPEGFRYAEID